jgi:hypothetical protein
LQDILSVYWTTRNIKDGELVTEAVVGAEEDRNYVAGGVDVGKDVVRVMEKEKVPPQECRTTVLEEVLGQVAAVM